MSYNISVLSYRRNSIAFQTVTKRSKSIITIINGRNVMEDNTVFLCDQPTMCSKQWPSIKNQNMSDTESIPEHYSRI
jgi:isocitrate/isopropylmalate dehydrogenase